MREIVIVLVRIWEASFDVAKKQKLIEYANSRSLPVLSSRPGCVGVAFYMSKDRLITQTIWRDQASIDALGDDPEYKTLVEGILALDALGPKQETEVFQLVGGNLVGS